MRGHVRRSSPRVSLKIETGKRLTSPPFFLNHVIKYVSHCFDAVFFFWRILAVFCCRTRTGTRPAPATAVIRTTFNGDGDVFSVKSVIRSRSHAAGAAFKGSSWRLSFPAHHLAPCFMLLASPLYRKHAFSLNRTHVYRGLKLRCFFFACEVLIFPGASERRRGELT